MGVYNQREEIPARNPNEKMIAGAPIMEDWAGMEEGTTVTSDPWGSGLGFSS